MNSFTLQITGNGNGRRIWAVHHPEGVAKGGYLAASPVSFPDDAAANTDFDLHSRLVMDNNGRKITSVAHINQMLAFALESFDDCQNCRIGDVYWHETDSGGNNWNVKVMNGDDVPGCLDHLEPILFSIRGMYNIAPKG